jgi:threonine/homoserine/homoserine lactone efflux protein
MEWLPALAAFTLVAALLAITPGLDTALVLHTAAARGARAAWRAAVGIAMGCLAWGLLAAAGLSAALLASATLFGAIKLAGAAYLVWLGIGLLRQRRADLGAASADGPADPLRQGLLTNLLNPKVGLFYVALLPQFVPPGAPAFALILAMTLIHTVLGLVWFALLIAAANRIGDLLRRPRVLLWLDRATGGLFIALGLKLALAAR